MVWHRSSVVAASRMFVAKMLLRNRRVCVLGVLAIVASSVVYRHYGGYAPTRSEPPDSYTVYMRGMKGQTGNLIFMFASLYGIARRNHRKAVMLRGCRNLRGLFLNISVRCVDSESDLRGADIEESAYATYDPSLETLPAGDTTLKGYYQSWKYFQEYASDIRQQLTFRPKFLTPATEFLASINNGSCRNCRPKTFVGVHVRRGDRVAIRHFRKRYSVASEGYLRKAMDYFRQKYDDVHFVVCSDSMKWCNKTLGGQKDVTFSLTRRHGTDLAILSLCNHTVFTVGTFGWWAAWLAGGTAVYYPDHVNVSTTLYDQLKADDYFIPDWIPITD